MKVRDVIGGALFVAVLVVLGVVGWQTTVNTAAIKNLNESNLKFSNGIEDLGKAFQSWGAKVNGLDTRVAAVESGPLANDVAKLKAQVAAQTDIDDNHSRMLRDIATSMDGGKTYMLNLEGNSQKPEFRQQFEKAVGDSISRPEGELWVYNDTQSDQWLRVNGGSPYTVPAKSGLTKHGLIFPVPSGTATTEIAGDGSKSWFIGAPNYRQVLIILPRERDLVQPHQAGQVVPQ